MQAKGKVDPKATTKPATTPKADTKAPASTVKPAAKTETKAPATTTKVETKPDNKTTTKSDTKTTTTLKTDPKTSATAKTSAQPSKTNSSLPSNQNSKATLDVKKATENLESQKSQIKDNASVASKTVSKANVKQSPKKVEVKKPKVSEKKEVKQDAPSTKQIPTTEKSTKSNTEIKQQKNDHEQENEISVKNDDLMSKLHTESIIDKDKTERIEKLDKVDKSEQQSPSTRNKPDQRNLIVSESTMEIRSIKEKQIFTSNNTNLFNDNKSHKFDSNKLLIEKVPTFDTQIITKNEKETKTTINEKSIFPIKESKLEADSIQPPSSPENYIVLKKSLKCKTFLLPKLKSNKSEDDPFITLKSNTLQGSKRIVSPQSKQGVSVFSHYKTALENSLFSSTKSPKNKFKVFFDSEFNQSEQVYNNESKQNMSSTFPFPRINSTNNEHANYLKELKQSKNNQTELGNLLNPANSSIKSSLLSPDNKFYREFKNVLERQKFQFEPLLAKKPTSNLAASNKLSFKQRVINANKKLSTKDDLIDYNTNNVNSFKKNIGMTSKGADLYVKLNDKIRW